MVQGRNTCCFCQTEAAGLPLLYLVGLGLSKNRFHTFVRLPERGHCTSCSMGSEAPERYPMVLRQRRHEYGSKDFAYVPPASHTVGERPRSGA
ncbi:hypothetical protein PoB_006862000 [Plakobranchus ocellatus]|uniref:Uncharacterized protein n=1 Tax=Plakobranchus ocellatus TaxID=259542 RepID=A0AAV4DDB5_9GAST|nr:hypothetical protein PoB_006862000 [Plakobranchus ocellatus]